MIAYQISRESLRDDVFFFFIGITQIPTHLTAVYSGDTHF